MQWNEPLKPENLQAMVKTVVGSNGEAKKVIDATKSDEVKKLLSANTEQAFADGAFGLPYFVGECVTSCGGIEANNCSDECNGQD